MPNLRHAEKIELKRGVIAKCSLGALGILTSDKPVRIKYTDGKFGRAWTGLHLTDHPDGVWKIGDPWSSHNPTAFCQFS